MRKKSKILMVFRIFYLILLCFSFSSFGEKSYGSQLEEQEDSPSPCRKVKKGKSKKTKLHRQPADVCKELLKHCEMHGSLPRRDHRDMQFILRCDTNKVLPPKIKARLEEEGLDFKIREYPKNRASRRSKRQNSEPHLLKTEQHILIQTHNTEIEAEDNEPDMPEPAPILPQIVDSLSEQNNDDIIIENANYGFLDHSPLYVVQHDYDIEEFIP